MNTFSSQAMQQMYVFSCIHFAGQWSLGHRIATYIRVPASVIEVNAASGTPLGLSLFEEDRRNQQ